MKRILPALLLCTILFSPAYSQDYSDYTSCALQDSLALVAFYHATDGPNWISNMAEDFSTDYLSDDVLIYYTVDYPNAGLNHWFDGPVKDWFGVTLAKQQVGNTSDSVWRVIHLHPTLSRRSSGENNLKGYVPEEVGLLTALEWFKVNGNAGLKNTEIPDELYHSSMIAFDFEGAFFSGIISDAIRKCTDLKYLNFRDNNFTSIPLFDFVTDPWTSLWVYRNQISWEILEPTIDFFVDMGYGYEARDQHDVGEAREVVVEPGSNVTLESSDAGVNGTYTWYKNGFNTYVTGPSRTFENVSAADTGVYTVLVANEYIRLNDGNADYVNTFTKPIHLTFTPSTPLKEAVYTSYDGNRVFLSFSKPMATPSPAQTGEFTIKRNGEAVASTGISLTGRLNNILVLELSESIFMEDAVSVSYASGSVVDENGGMVTSFSEEAVTNLVRKTPQLISAITRVDGGGIILGFDQYMDADSFDPSDFTISGTTAYTVVDITLNEGDLDEHISTKITLIMNDPLWDTDTISVSYTKGSLAALYGAAAQSVENYAVENIVVADRTLVNLKVIDGTKKMKQLVVNGDMNSLPFVLYDDGTNGDETAGDFTWTKALQLTEGEYDWKVFERSTITSYDTVIIEDEFGQITITLSPKETYVDSLISGSAILNLVVSDKLASGDSTYNFRTNKVTFILDLEEYLAANNVTAEPYLMGINDDWTMGFLMADVDSLNPNTSYFIILSGYAPDDVINFAFRNGDSWETTSITTRIHTVSGNDTVYANFGVITTGLENSKPAHLRSLQVYPNPANDHLSIHLSTGEDLVSTRIYNLYGQCVFASHQTTSLIDISSLQSGAYIVVSNDEPGNIYRSQFIKK